MILGAFEVNFHDKNDGIPLRACRRQTTFKKNAQEMCPMRPKKFNKNNVQDMDAKFNKNNVQDMDPTRLKNNVQDVGLNESTAKNNVWDMVPTSFK